MNIMIALSVLFALQQADVPTITTYPVHDLVTRHLDLWPDPEKPKLTVEQASLAKAERLARVIGAFIEPRLEGDRKEIVEAVTTHPDQRQLLAIARPAQHQWIAAFLAHSRKVADDIVLIQGRVFAVDHEILKQLEIGSMPRIFQEKDDLDRFVEQLRVTALVSGIEVPVMEVRTAESWSMSNMHEIPYIKGYRQYAQVAPVNRDVVVPEIAMAPEGFNLTGDLAVLDHQMIGVIATLELSSVEQPIPERSTPLGPIADPAMERSKVSTTVTFPDGGGFIMAVPRLRPEGKRRAVLIHAHVATSAELARLRAGVKSFELK